MIYGGAAAFLLALLLPARGSTAAVPERALQLRDRGIAQLENEQPARAETTFRELAAVHPGDPLAHANLAIALLRQHKHDAALTAIQRALERAPGRADLLAIHGEILRWSGTADQALRVLQRAARAAPDDPLVQYALLSHASASRDQRADESALQALTALVRLRPENLYVLLQRGQRAIAAGDRANATRAYLRVRELLWQAPPASAPALQEVLDRLEAGEVAEARVPASRLENVLKATAMYQASLGELRIGIQGVPVDRFVDEPPPVSFGKPVDVRFRGHRLDRRPTAGKDLAVGDFDGDQRSDIARLRGGEESCLEIRLASEDWKETSCTPVPGLIGLLAVDLSNDGQLDLVAFGPQAMEFFRGRGDGTFEAEAEGWGLAGGGAESVFPFDFDIDGDLDLAVGGGGSGRLELYRNNLVDPLEPVADKALPQLELDGVRVVYASDVDRDGALDLIVGHEAGVAWLRNLRQGRFSGPARVGTVAELAGASDLVAADLSQNAHPDLIIARETGLGIFQNRQGAFQPSRARLDGAARKSFVSVVAFDADNDGRLDLAAAGSEGVVALARRTDRSFVALPVEHASARVTAIAAVEMDGDGDLDLVLAGPDGLHWLENIGGNRNHYLQVRLRGLTTGSSKNNVDGLGSTIEVRSGRAYQLREVSSQVTHFGLGQRKAADVVRLTWTNGVPQNRLALEGNQLVVEEQLLKGSCPFLYAWDGEGFRFVTDLLWGAPLGLPVAPGVYADSHPEELVLVEGAVPVEGRYELRVTEELWEAALFDYVRLWVVDHPEDVEVASTLRIVPGGEPIDPGVLASSNLQPVARAWDGQGRDVTERIARRDGAYADGFEPGPYQGVARDPWALTFDFGEPPDGPVRLQLEGWIFPSDASLNLAMAQRGDLVWLPPRLEVETQEGWRVLLPDMGFPPGKTKRMVVDTPPLPTGAHRLRVVTSLWISWDRIAWTAAPADEEPQIVSRRTPVHAELRFRGFSEMLRRAPNAPHEFDYERISVDSPWLPFPGRYTRYGGVRELLLEPDDRMVILGPGDELVLAFDASDLPPPRPGWARSVFLESHGWDKDADKNTYQGHHLEPLPFRTMSGYPYGPDESYPDTDVHREYVREWLTREVE